MQYAGWIPLGTMCNVLRLCLTKQSAIHTIKENSYSQVRINLLSCGKASVA